MGLCRGKARGREEGKLGAKGLLALLSEYTAFAADEIQMYLNIRSALCSLPFTAGDGCFLQDTVNTLTKETYFLLQRKSYSSVSICQL